MALALYTMAVISYVILVIARMHIDEDLQRLFPWPLCILEILLHSN